MVNLIQKYCTLCKKVFTAINHFGKKSRKLCDACFVKKKQEVMMITNKCRIRNKSIKCKSCNKVFLAANKNARFCQNCRCIRNNRKKNPAYLKSEHYHLKSIEWSHNHRVRAKVSLSRFRAKFIDQLKIDYNDQCVYCASDQNLTVDHLTPVAKGGSNEYDNLVLACKTCNSSKRDTMPLNFILRRISKSSQILTGV
jgi:5-methylcytosine-specific restriction endonuclease McrA